MDWLSIAALIVAAMSWWASRQQAKRADDAIRLSRQVATADTVMHFTDRFFELLKEGDPHEKLLTDPDWAYRFWGLHAAEFYFFHHGLLPRFMFTLWLMDLADLYSGENGSAIRATHVRYLNVYSQNYEAMCGFYETLYDLTAKPDAEVERNRQISEWTETWFTEHRRDEFV